MNEMPKFRLECHQRKIMKHYLPPSVCLQLCDLQAAYLAISDCQTLLFLVPDTCLILVVCISSGENWMNTCIWEQKHLMFNAVEVSGYCCHVKCVLEQVSKANAYALEQLTKKCFLLSVGALCFFTLVICTLLLHQKSVHN